MQKSAIGSYRSPWLSMLYSKNFEEGFILKNRIFAFTFCCLCLAGCAVPPALNTPYNDQATEIRQDLAQNKTNAAETSLQGEIKSDPQLYTMELGRIEQLSGNYAESIKNYNVVINAFNAKATAPKIQLRKFVKGSQQNNYAAYAPQPYEKVLVFQYQGINYLAEGKLDDALVDFRQAETLEAYLNAHALPKIQKKWPIPTPPSGAPSYADLLTQTRTQSSVSNSLSNGVADFIAGLAFLNAGDLNSASLSMQNAETLLPVPLFQEEALLAMKKSGMTPEVIAAKQKSVGAPVSFPDQKKPGGTSPVFVMTEQGFVPILEQNIRKVPIPGTSYQADFIVPYYPITPLPLEVYALSIDNTTPVMVGDMHLSVADLATASLLERYPKIIGNASDNTNNTISTILGDLSAVQSAQEAVDTLPPQLPGQSDADYAKEVESAQNALIDAQFTLSMDLDDLSAPHTTDINIRTWSTLPEDIHIQKLELLPGSHTLIVTDAQQNPVATCSFSSQQGENALIWVNTQLPTPVCQQLL